MSRPARAAGFLIPLFLCAALASALGGDEKKPSESESPKPGAAGGNGAAAQNRPVQVSGRVRLVGSSVFPELVISGENREWFISKDEQSKLFELQQRFVTVMGTESCVDLTFANGSQAGRRYTLENIRLISIDRPPE
ncbi:MAG: hypothetical protein LBO04_03350 [Spirochaetaceae bacterium]|jgi:hypothetical protein|nr:hypothetical protein [Spirochaetaceae bacterium]